MSKLAWIGCVLWICAAIGTAAFLGLQGIALGRKSRALARLKSPTVYLFAAYLLIAAWVTPLSPGESTSPLAWLALVLPVAYALATLSSIGKLRRHASAASALALLHGGAVLAAAAIVLALASPSFVPAFLKP